jgi:L-ascorbate metabolism protein UlaG (beta-lactamase superfamily)
MIHRVPPVRLLCLGLMAFFATLPMAAQGGLRLTYFGTAGWEITDGKTVVLVDPYFTRPKMRTPNDDVSPDDPRPMVTANSVVAPATEVIDAHIQRAGLMLITHTHPDHALDMPYIARKTGATVIGTESTINLARASGVPKEQLKPVKGREELKFDGVSVRVIPSVHGIFRRPQGEAKTPAAPPPLFPADAQPPFQLRQYAEGGTLAYLIGIGGHQVIVFGSMNYLEQELVGLRPDVALIGAMPERHNIDDYTVRLMRVLGNPAVVLPTHWDRFNVPHTVSQQPALDRLQSFIAEVKAASPETKVIVPEYFKPIRIGN